MARQYKRDNRGRFSSTGSARSARPATRMVSRGTNRLTRDNAGRITSVGGQGATARGGRLRTASGKLRATQLVRMKGTGGKLRGPMGGGTPRISRAEPIMTGGTLAARSSLTRAKRKLEQNPTPAQRGAVTRAKKYAAQSYDRNTGAKAFGRPASVMRKRPPERPAWWGVKGGGGASKPVGWMQSPGARALRTKNAADRSDMAKRIRSLPKAARRSIFKKTDPVQAQQNRNRASILEGLQRDMAAKASAKRVREQQKPKRIAFVRVYHGTSKEAAKSIRSGGYKGTLRGLYGPGVYGSTSRKVAREYADWRAAGAPDMTQKRGRAKVKPNSPSGAVLTHRISTKRLAREAGKMDSDARRELVSKGRVAGIRIQARHTGKRGLFAIMRPDIANRTLIRQSGIISAPRRTASRRRDPA